MTETEAAEIERRMSEAVRRINADLYYFGHDTLLPHPAHTVLDRLVEWKKGDPKEWTQRMFKPYVPKV